MKQDTLDIQEDKKVVKVEEFKFAPPQQPPMGMAKLWWQGKRPFTSTQYFPAQLKEQHGDEVNGWLNEIYWGDNLQVMSNLLKKYRGKVDLIYIDPPFDSKADYKKTIGLRGKKVENDLSSFEEKQYTDIWSNDEYLQFIYSRLILLREFLSENGSLYLHCDWHKCHLLRSILDEVFSPECFQNEIIWQKLKAAKKQAVTFGNVHDTILMYTKRPESFYHEKQYTGYSQELIDSHYNKIDSDGRRYTDDSFTQTGQGAPRRFGDRGVIAPPSGKHWIWSQDKIDEGMRNGTIIFTSNGTPRVKRYLDERKGLALGDIWSDIFPINSQAIEALDYPTQKPEALLERIIKASSNPGDIVFDCFMGSGTTQAVAMKLGRRFIGADINLGAIQTTTKRLIGVAKELNKDLQNLDGPRYTGFTVYNVNNYDVFRNPVQAKDLLVEALELQPMSSDSAKLRSGSVFDGYQDDWLVKIMPVNRIATRADLNEIIHNFDYKGAEKFAAEHPNSTYQKIRLVCMGHEPDLAATLKAEIKYKIEVEILDILRDKRDLQFKRDASAKIVRKAKKLVIEKFYPMNLLQKLSLEKQSVDDWRELVESVMIDFNYDGSVFTPSVTDIPEKDELVSGEYAIPEGAGTIRVKITDLLSESLEQEVK